MKDDTLEPFKKSLNFTDAKLHRMSFLEYCTHADTLVAADYEGSFNHRDYFTHEQWAYTKSF